MKHDHFNETGLLTVVLHVYIMYYVIKIKV